MYTPEINFLKQRSGAGTAESSAGTVISPTVAQGIRSGASAAIIGVGFALTLLVAYGLVDYFVQNRLRTLKAEQSRVTEELGAAEAERTRLNALNDELQGIQARTDAFKAFFNQVQPWSSILEDIRNQIPSDTWITDISASNSTVSIEGQSSNFDSVNDFQLTLLQSALVDDASIVRAELVSEAADVEGLPPTEVVDYEVRVQLTSSSIEDLLITLEENGSTGLVQKVELLRALENQQ